VSDEYFQIRLSKFLQRHCNFRGTGHIHLFHRVCYYWGMCQSSLQLQQAVIFYSYT